MLINSQIVVGGGKVVVGGGKGVVGGGKIVVGGGEIVARNEKYMKNFRAKSCTFVRNEPHALFLTSKQKLF